MLPVKAEFGLILTTALAHVLTTSAQMPLASTGLAAGQPAVITGAQCPLGKSIQSRETQASPLGQSASSAQSVLRQGSPESGTQTLPSSALRVVQPALPAQPSPFGSHVWAQTPLMQTPDPPQASPLSDCWQAGQPLQFWPFFFRLCFLRF